MKRKKSKTTVFYTVGTVFLIVVLLFALGNALKIYLPQKQAQAEFELLQQEAAQPAAAGGKRFAGLLQRNPDFVGWLNLDDTIINYPVLQPVGKDAEYYLRRNFDGKYSYSGSLFVGAGCDVNSDAFIVYGHNMGTDTMFGTLDSYADTDFAQKHRDILFFTPEEDRVYRVFAAFQTKVEEGGDVFRYYEAVGSLPREAYEEAVAYYRALSMIQTGEAPQYPQQLLLLSTCSYHTSNGRFVVVAYRTK